MSLLLDRRKKSFMLLVSPTSSSGSRCLLGLLSLNSQRRKLWCSSVSVVNWRLEVSGPQPDFCKPFGRTTDSVSTPESAQLHQRKDATLLPHRQLLQHYDNYNYYYHPPDARRAVFSSCWGTGLRLDYPPFNRLLNHSAPPLSLPCRAGFFHRSLSGRADHVPKILNKRSRHSTEWIKRQITDRYVLKAQEDCYRSRAAYKLQQMDDRFLILRRNQLVVDLGCYPGGWSQVATERIVDVGNRSTAQRGSLAGRVIGVDKVRTDPLPQHSFIQGEVGDETLVGRLLEEFGDRKADVVLSDMSPACIGLKQDDHLLSADLGLKALDLAEQILKLGGWFVVKIFMGSQTPNYSVLLKTRFKGVKSVKPRASRRESPEMYFVCKDFIGRTAIAEEVQIKGPFSHREGYY